MTNTNKPSSTANAARKPEENPRSHLIMLLFAGFFWGTTFVAQRIGAGHVGAWTYLASRSWIAVVFLSAIIPAFDRFREKRGEESRKPRTPDDRKQLLIAGLCCGVMLCLASVAQQIGIAYTTASKAGFITALYVIIVPVLSIFLKNRPSLKIWGCVVLALIGMYLLCMKPGSFRLEIGDAWVSLCALLFALQIMILSHFSPLVDGVRLSRLQFLVVAVISTLLMFLTESPTPETLKLALPAILYAGIFSSGIAYTLQILGQENVNPTLASMIMSLESVFSALTGWLILGEQMSGRELFGSLLMFAAIVLAQIEPKKKARDTHEV